MYSIDEFCKHVVSQGYFKGCVRYIFASLFLSLKESTCETRKNVFNFTLKALFVVGINKILDF